MNNTYFNTSRFTKQHPLITGTLLLTATGFLNRIIGFFYRIYLSRLFGEEGMGIYQLIHPVIALTFSLTAASFQTTISKLVAEQTTDTAAGEEKSYKPFLLGLSISLPLSLLGMAVLYLFSDVIAFYYLQEIRTAELIKLLSFTLPFSAAHACMNGYFYGIKKSSVPAWTQFLEQIFRVAYVYFIAALTISGEGTPDLTLAVAGLVAGELAGFFGIFIVMFRKYHTETKRHITYSASSATYKGLLAMAVPLAANRVFLNILQSIEAVSIPTCLKQYGYDSSTALSVYGVLTGMAFPLLFFPNTVTGSVSVLLLPTISENMATGRTKEVKRIILQTIQYCSILGFFCMAFFLFFGRSIGRHLFDSDLAGFFICELSFLCPFLYLNNTLSGVLHGLGKATPLFLSNIAVLVLRLIIINASVPVFGMQGYFWALLVSQICQTALFLSILFFSKKLAHHAIT